MKPPEPMKAMDLTRDVDLAAEDLGLARFYDGKFVMEPKVDGCRLVIELQADGNIIYSRGRDVSAHFPHLRDATITPSMNGFMLDGELLANGPDGQVLSAATSLLVSSPANAIRKQALYGNAWFMAFDVLSLGAAAEGDIMRAPYDARRLALETVIPPLSEAADGMIKIIESFPASPDILEKFRNGEGFMIKQRSSLYHPGGRSGGWWKFKWLSTCDAFITGWKPGENSLSGMVGSVTLSIFSTDSRTVEVATVGVFTNEFRRQLTSPTGALKSEYYGQVVEFACQGIGTQGMARHPRFVRMRPDKRNVDCTIDQLNAIPRV